MKLRVLAEAEQELKDAMHYYDDCRAGLGDEFLACVNDAITAIEREPLRYALYEGRRTRRIFRRILVSRFPYIVVYESLPNEIVVAAVAHTSREPAYWDDRE